MSEYSDHFKKLSALLSTYLRQYFHLTFCVLLLTAYSYKSHTQDINWTYCIWASLVTFLLYNYYQLINVRRNNLSLVFKHNFPVYAIIIISFTLGIALIWNNFIKLALFSVALLTTYLYFKVDEHDGKSGRDYRIFKPVAIGIVYSIITLMIPSQDFGLTISESLLVSAGRMSFIMALSLIFDICDVRENEAIKNPTLTETIGIKKTKLTITFLLFIASLIETMAVWSFLIDLHTYLAMMITLFMTLILGIKANQQRPIWYSLLLTDSMMMAPYIISFI